MTFTVIWASNAEAKLAQLWLTSANRQQVTTAASKIDYALQTNANSIGESRAEGRRIFHETPLGVIYFVNLEDRTVFVLDVWRFAAKEQRGT